jgi:hypothetical protein
VKVGSSLEECKNLFISNNMPTSRISALAVWPLAKRYLIFAIGSLIKNDFLMMPIAAKIAAFTYNITLNSFTLHTRLLQNKI